PAHNPNPTPNTHIPTNQLNAILQHTWARYNQSSQLDDFWMTSDIISNCPGINLSTSTGSTDSNHVILDFKWLLPQALTARNKKKTTRKKYLYHKMTEET
ncbi:35353_t:CDS:1, partial [Gigaspora margarita]